MTHPLMATITWTAEAQRWLEDIFEYIAADNPCAAGLRCSNPDLRPRSLTSMVLKPGKHVLVGSN